MRELPHHPRVQALKRRMHSDDLHADVLRVYGYAGECPCGWKGRTVATFDLARLDLRDHRKHEHPPAST